MLLLQPRSSDSAQHCLAALPRTRRACRQRVWYTSGTCVSLLPSVLLFPLSEGRRAWDCRWMSDGMSQSGNACAVCMRRARLAPARRRVKREGSLGVVLRRGSGARWRPMFFSARGAGGGSRSSVRSPASVRPGRDPRSQFRPCGNAFARRHANTPLLILRSRRGQHAGYERGGDVSGTSLSRRRTPSPAHIPSNVGNERELHPSTSASGVSDPPPWTWFHALLGILRMFVICNPGGTRLRVANSLSDWRYPHLIYRRVVTCQHVASSYPMCHRCVS